MFRRTLVGLAVLAWILVAATLAHRSETPTVLGRWSSAWCGAIGAATAIAALLTLANRRSIYVRLDARRRELALLLGTTLVALLGVEAFLRVVDPIGLAYYKNSTRYQLDKVADPDLVFFHRPGLHARYGDVEVATNELGMRDRPIGDKPQGELRVLALGDSVTFGWGVPAASVFCSRLEPLLEAGLGRHVRVLNSGCGGFNTVQELALLRKLGPSLEPDVVILTYVENDVDEVAPPFQPAEHLSLHGKSSLEAAKLLLGRSWLWRLAWHDVQLGSAPSLEERRSQPGWRESLEALAAIDDWCRQRGLPFALFFWRAQADPWNDALLSEIAELGRARGFEVCDVLPWFQGRTLRSLLLSPIDSHPNGAGHELLARGMAQVLLEKVLRR